MTPDMKRCLDTVDRLMQPGVAPTYRQIAAAMGCAVSYAHGLVMRLADAGYLRIGKGYRSIEILKREDLKAHMARLVVTHGAEAVERALRAAKESP